MESNRPDQSNTPHRRTDYDLPVKSVDSDADVSERVSDNVKHQVGPGRYFTTDRLGNTDTCWDDVFDRVSRNVAIAEIAHHDLPIDRPIPTDEGDGGVVRVNEQNAHKFTASQDFLDSLPAEVRGAYDGWRDRFYDAMAELRFMPNTPTLTSAGTTLQQLSACFVASPGDELTDIDDAGGEKDSIFGTAEQWARIEQTGGGMGGAFYNLRPKGAKISSTDGVSSGPMAFIELFDVTGKTIKQGGVRSGAQMAVFHAHHPDVGRFCVAKRGDEDLTCFNISVGITDEFLEAVENDEDYVFGDPETGELGFDADPFEVVPETAHFYDPAFEDAWNDEYDKPAEGYDGKVVEENFWRDHYQNMSDPSRFDEYRDRIDIEPGEPMKLPARFVWELIVDGAHNNGEPGVLHLDRARREHSFDVDFESGTNTEYHQWATNPCAEQFLSEYEACNLGHVNLSLMVDEDRDLWSEYMDARRGDGWDESTIRNFVSQALDGGTLERTVRTGTRFLDNVVTMSDFPLDEISDRVGRLRKIGLGVMGFHQMLMQMGVEYGSEESQAIAEEIMRLVDAIATDESRNLAHERGVFPAWEDSKWSDPGEYPEWFEKHAHADPTEYERGYPVRNHNITTVAPTGTTGRIGNTSLSIEPIYSVAYFSNVGDDVSGEEMLVNFDDYFSKTLELNDIDADAVKQEAKELMLANSFEGIESLSTVPDGFGDIFVASDDVGPREHVGILTAFQEYTDSSISKTCNLPNEAGHDDVSDIFRTALHDGAKSVTVYRDGSRNEQVLTTRVDNKLDDDAPVDWLVEQIDNETAYDVVQQLTEQADVEKTVQATCDECGSGQLDISESCPVCLECGYSPCQ